MSLVSSILTSVFALFGIWFTHWLKHRKDLLHRNAEFLIKDLFVCNEILNSILTDTGCIRAVLLKAEDSGEPIKKGIPVYSSVITEAYHPDHVEIKKDWQNQRVDAAYVDVLLSVLNESQLFLSTKDLPEGDLKYFYQVKGIAQSEVNLLYANDTRSEMIYLSVVYLDPQTDLQSPFIREVMRGAINRLQNLMESVGPYL